MSIDKINQKSSKSEKGVKIVRFMGKKCQGCNEYVKGESFDCGCN